MLGEDDEDLQSDLPSSHHLSRSDLLVEQIVEEQERGVTLVDPVTLKRPTVQVDLTGEKRHLHSFEEALSTHALTQQARQAHHTDEQDHDHPSETLSQVDQQRIEDAVRTLHANAPDLTDDASLTAYHDLVELTKENHAEACYQLALLYQVSSQQPMHTP